MKILAAACGLWLGSSMTARAGEAIQIRPGQCIFVGAQEVCALRCSETATTVTVVPPAPRPVAHASCKYGDRPDDPGMKGYTLVQILLKDDGSKRETVIKTFGSMPADKAECEREARRLDDKL